MPHEGAVIVPRISQVMSLVIVGSNRMFADPMIFPKQYAPYGETDSSQV